MGILIVYSVGVFCHKYLLNLLHKKIITMKNQFIQYEMSVKLKELGFNEKCFDVYSDVKSVGMFRNSPRDRTPKILWQQAFSYIFKISNGKINISIYGNDNYESLSKKLEQAIKDFRDI